MNINEWKTLGELLDDPRISLIASDAIKNRDSAQEDHTGQ